MKIRLTLETLISVKTLELTSDVCFSSLYNLIWWIKDKVMKVVDVIDIVRREVR